MLNKAEGRGKKCIATTGGWEVRKKVRSSSTIRVSKFIYNSSDEVP